MAIAFFDFDGTITSRDSLFVFTKFVAGKRKFYCGILSRFYVLLFYIVGIYSNTRAKLALVRYFFKDLDEKYFNNKCEEFQKTLDSIIKKSALEKIKWHKSRGDEVVIVSATFENYLLPLCARLEVECIGTKLEIKEGKLSGEFSGENCINAQKVKRIQEKYNLKNYDEIYAYGDSSGDKEMLDLATHRFWRSFA